MLERSVKLIDVPELIVVLLVEKSATGGELVGLQPPKPEDRRVASAPQQGGERSLVGQAKDNGPLTIAFDKFDDEEISNNLISTVEELSKNRFFYIFPSRDSNIDEINN